MKKFKKYMLLIIGLVSMSTFILSRQDVESYKQLVLSGIEALSSGESTITVYCRCHEDNKCYSGNWVSLRGFCFSGTIVDTPDYFDCHKYDSTCE